MELTQEYLDQQFNLNREYFDQKFGELDTKFVSQEYFDQKFGELDTKFVSQEYLDQKFEAYTEHFDQKLNNLEANLENKMDDKIDDLAIMVANGFEDLQVRLDVRDRVTDLEYDMKKIKKALLVD